MQSKIKTHYAINQELCGAPVSLKEDYAKIKLTTTKEMAVDDRGLVHGGFVFGLADYAAMLAVNHPNVVLAGSTVTFKKPVVVGDKIVAEAEAASDLKRKATVSVSITRDKEVVFYGEFYCVSLDNHVLESV